MKSETLYRCKHSQLYQNTLSFQFQFPEKLVCIEKNLRLEIKDNESLRLERLRERERRMVEKRSAGVQVLLNVPADGQTGCFHIETWIPSPLFS